MQLQPCYIKKIIPVHEEVPFEVMEEKRYTLDEILFDVCKTLDYPVWRIQGKSRKREVVMCRMIYCYVAKAKTGYSLKSIGESVGGRDHTTVIHARQTIKDLSDTRNELFMAFWHHYLENSTLFTKYDF